MANLSIRKLNDAVYGQLRLRAANHGISMEEEARRIICLAVSAPEKITDVFQKYFGQENGIDLEFVSHRKSHNPMDLDE